MGKARRVRLRAEFGSPDFLAEYQRAVAQQHTKQRSTKGQPASLLWLIARYRESLDWTRLSSATRKQRENIFLHVIEAAGGEPYSAISRSDIKSGIDRRLNTPFAANNFLKAMRGLFRWARDADLIERDPTEGLRGSTPRTDGFPCWTEEELARFEERWPIGTRERLAYAILLYTGLRRGDAAKLGRQHIHDGVIELRTEKNGTPVGIPTAPELADALARTKTGDLAFIAKANGAPLSKEAFGNRELVSRGVRSGGDPWLGSRPAKGERYPASGERSHGSSARRVFWLGGR
jgi:integrase